MAMFPQQIFVCEAVLDAEVRIGELLRDTQKASGGDRKSDNFKKDTAVPTFTPFVKPQREPDKYFDNKIITWVRLVCVNLHEHDLGIKYSICQCVQTKTENISYLFIDSEFWEGKIG